jgi:hypothetical protein
MAALMVIPRAPKVPFAPRNAGLVSYFPSYVATSATEAAVTAATDAWYSFRQRDSAKQVEAIRIVAISINVRLMHRSSDFTSRSP